MLAGRAHAPQSRSPGRDREDRQALPRARHCHSDNRPDERPGEDPGVDSQQAWRGRSLGTSSSEPLSYLVEERTGFAGRWLQPRQLDRVPSGIDAGAGTHHRTLREVLSNRVSQGRGCVRLSRAAANLRRSRSEHPEVRVAEHGEFLPWRCIRQCPHRLRRGGDPAGRNVGRAFRVAALDRRRDHRHAGIGIEREGDLRQVSGDRGIATRPRDPESVRRAGQRCLALPCDGQRHRGDRRSDRRSRSQARCLRLGHRQRGDHRRR